MSKFCYHLDPLQISHPKMNRSKFLLFVFVACSLGLAAANENTTQQFNGSSTSQSPRKANTPNSDLPPMPTLDLSNFELPKSTVLIKNLTDRPTRSSFFNVGSTRSADVTDLATSSRPLINSMNTFTFKLFSYLMEKYSNIIISPISLYSSLIVLHAASSGSTEAQLSKLLALTGLSDKQIAASYRSILDSMDSGLGDRNQLKLINTMLVDKKVPISPTYVDKMTKFYNLAVESVEFATEAEHIFQFVNNQVNWQTDGHIKSILDKRPDPLSKLLLLNAVHFKGEWAKSFNPKDTTPMNFRNAEKPPTKVKMMKMVNEFDAHCDNMRVRGPNAPLCSIKIPYEGEQITMQIIQSGNAKISLKDALERRLNAQLLQELEAKYSPKLVELGLPSFKLEDIHELREPMDFLGANSMFTRDRANLNKFLTRSSPTGNSTGESNKDSSADLFVNQFRHKASIAVNEQGTVASAATSVLIGNRSGTNKFYVDRPFILIIKDERSGAILFMGRINNLDAENAN